MEVVQSLLDFPAVAILGPRQAGKSTLARKVTEEIGNAVYLDLEKPSDLRRLSEPEIFLNLHREKLICLDEIQRAQDLFAVLRGRIDENARNGQFLILGSASRDLIRQSSESLAGRIAYLELSPFDLAELVQTLDDSDTLLEQTWLRGGFPRSFLSLNDSRSLNWRDNFIRTFLERDIPQLGFQIPAKSVRRLWQMCAHTHGQILNASRLGESLGVSHTTIRTYLDLLQQTFMVLLLPPCEANLKKRLVKSPKLYIRDSGILHALLEIESLDELIGHPVYGASWEGFALENILSVLPKWNKGFYRTSSGAELDLVLTRGQKRIGVEFKASKAPHLSRGFWNAIDDLQLERTWVIAPVPDSYPVAENVEVSGLAPFLENLLSESL
ncbi:ATP-binding protein [bacterium]|nr:ATP-binding protein [bacterium]